MPCSRSVGVFSGGTAPFTWTASGLPAGMSIRTGDGVTSSWITPGDVELWGSPDATGTFSVQLTVTDATGATATNTFPLKVSPLVQTAFLPNGTVGTAYSQTLRVIGGTGPYTARADRRAARGRAHRQRGTLVVSGTPIESGKFNPAFTYTDSAGHTLQSDRSMTVNGGGSNVSINTNSDLGSATTGSSYSNTLVSRAARDPITWSLIGGTLPPGLTLSSSGHLSGTPSTSGTYTFLVKATSSTTPPTSRRGSSR